MAHDKHLLKLADIPLFKSFLFQIAVECRAGKGEFQVMQIKHGNDWLAVCRNKEDVLTTPPGLRDIISRFDEWSQFSTPGVIASVIARPEQKKPRPADEPADSDLRDDFAIAALSNLSHRLGSRIQDRTWTAEALAVASYELADAMLVARDARRQPRKADEWPAEWKASGFNHCVVAARDALRFLAKNDRPEGGEDKYNFEHLHQIADELEITKRELLS